MEQIYEKLTKIAGYTRELTNTTDKLGLDAIGENLGAVVQDVNAQDNLIEQIAAALDGKAGGNPEIEDGLVAGTLTEYTNKRLAAVRDYAFYHQNFQEVNLPACKSIGSYAFVYCSSLISVNIPICAYIGGSAFWSCTGLTSVNFPMCSTIRHYTFQSCTSLAFVNFPMCTAIYNSGFCSCYHLTSVNLPECIGVNEAAFRNCLRLPSINLPKCTFIGHYAFSECTRLEVVDLGKDTSSKCSINPSAFNLCKSLTKLFLRHPSLATLSNVNVFINTPMSNSSYLGYFGSIYVPASLVDTYKSATNWAAYADRIAAIDELGGGE